MSNWKINEMPVFIQEEQPHPHSRNTNLAGPWSVDLYANENNNALLNKAKDSKSDSFQTHLSEADHRVLRVIKLCPDKIQMRHIVNLFGYFGELLKMAHNPIKKIVLIEFANHQDSQSALNFLKNICFFGEKLRMGYSRYPTLTNSVIKELISNKNYTILNVNKSDSFDFLKQPNETTCISRIIEIHHLSESMNSNLVHELFRTLHEPERVVEITSPNSNDKTCLVEFKSIYHAIEILAEFQNIQIDNNIISISFKDTKSIDTC